MNDKYTIGLDFGTLSARGVLVNIKNGDIVAKASHPYSHGILFESATTSYQHPMDYVEAMNMIVLSLVTKVDARDIIGIGVDFTSCTMLPIDKFGIPLCIYEEYKDRKNAYVKLWKHHGAQKYADKINSYLKEKGMDQDIRFGGKVSSELLIPKIMETYYEDPDIYEATYGFMEAGDYMTFLLCNSLKKSMSFAGYKNWFTEDYLEDDFYKELGIEGVKNKFRGAVLPVGHIVRDEGLCEKWAMNLGLEAGIPIAPAVIDSHAGVPGSHIINSKQAMLVLGTSSVLIGLADHPYSQKGIVGHVKDGIVPNYYGYESGVAAVGDLMNWFIDTQVPASYIEEAKEKNLTIYELLNEKASKLEKSSILVLDYFNGNKTPYVDSDLKGAILGLTLDTKVEEIYLSLVEATAFSTKLILEEYINQGIAIQSIVASGTIALENPYIMQVYATILNKPIYIADSKYTAALGSAIYATMAGKVYSYEEAVEKMSKVKDIIYLPDSTKQDYYTKKYDQYCKLAKVLVEDHPDLLK